MKKLMIMLGALLMLVLVGCSTTRITETITTDPVTKEEKKVTTTEELSAVYMLFDEMKIKDIAWWTCGWYFKITCQFTGSDTYLPNFTIKGGKVNIGHISLTKDSQQDMYKCIRAMQMPISVSVTKDGAKISESLSDEEKEFLNDSIKDKANDMKEKLPEVINGDG